MRVLRSIWEQLIGLVVDDGFLAIAALAAIGITWFVTAQTSMDPTNSMGWMLFGLLAASVAVSCRRAVMKHLKSLE